MDLYIMKARVVQHYQDLGESSQELLNKAEKRGAAGFADDYYLRKPLK